MEQFVNKIIYQIDSLAVGLPSKYGGKGRSSSTISDKTEVLIAIKNVNIKYFVHTFPSDVGLTAWFILKVVHWGRVPCKSSSLN